MATFHIGGSESKINDNGQLIVYVTVPSIFRKKQPYFQQCQSKVRMSVATAVSKAITAAANTELDIQHWSYVTIIDIGDISSGPHKLSSLKSIKFTPTPPPPQKYGNVP